jgi:hypothetical protein
MKKRLFVSVIPAVACLALAAPALAATQVGASENWAGYVVTSNDDSGFSAVSGQWTEPKVACTANAQPTYSAYWVGLGGGGQQSSALEQIGTQADCSAAGTARHYAWYELVPSAPVKLSLKIDPGDRIWARTAVNGAQVTLLITDQTSHQTWSKTLTMASTTPDTSTAEWVAEAPSECAGATVSNCTPLPLADFGTTTFTDAHATSAGGHTGSIDDSQWTAEAVELEPSSSSLFGGGPGGLPGGYGSYSQFSGYTSRASGAAPTSLRKQGTSFSVKYGASLETQSGAPGGSQAPYGYGYYGGYGYGDYGYGSYGDGGVYGSYGGWGY